MFVVAGCQSSSGVRRPTGLRTKCRRSFTFNVVVHWCFFCFVFCLALSKYYLLRRSREESKKRRREILICEKDAEFKNCSKRLLIFVLSTFINDVHYIPHPKGRIHTSHTLRAEPKSQSWCQKDR